MIYADRDGRTIQDAHYSNYDHSLDADCEEGLRTGKHYCQHAAWNFCGWIWFEGGKFHEEVMRYRVTEEVMSHESLRELILAVNEKYGFE